MEAVPPFSGLPCSWASFPRRQFSEEEGREGAGRGAANAKQGCGISWRLAAACPWAPGCAHRSTRLLHLKPFVPVCPSLTGHGCLPRGGAGQPGLSQGGQVPRWAALSLLPCQPPDSWGSDALSGRGRLGGTSTTVTPAFPSPQTQRRCRGPVTRKLMVGKGTGFEHLDGLERLQPPVLGGRESPNAMAGPLECSPPPPLCQRSSPRHLC